MEIFDVETAFLYGDLDKEIFMWRAITATQWFLYVALFDDRKNVCAER